MIKTHKELADLIAGKSILHLNSLGKDSVISLEWLNSFASLAQITSVYFDFFAKNPQDTRYLSYIKKRFPNVRFISGNNTFELTFVYSGVYQSPIDVLKNLNHQEYNTFDFAKLVECVRDRLNCDYIRKRNLEVRVL